MGICKSLFLCGKNIVYEKVKVMYFWSVNVISCCFLYFLMVMDGFFWVVLFFVCFFHRGCCLCVLGRDLCLGGIDGGYDDIFLGDDGCFCLFFCFFLR